MKKKSVYHLLLLIAITMLFSHVMSSSANAQFYPYFNPYYIPTVNPFYGCFMYYPSLLPPISSNPFLAYGRRAHVPLTGTGTSLFPAPILPTVPFATTGGVGLTTLIPTVPVTVATPLTALITSPLAGLITYTPLSLVGLTYAPVPITTTAAVAPIIIPTVAPTVSTTVTVGAATSAAIISLLNSLLI